jgi:signal transduction histidine kinase
MRIIFLAITTLFVISAIAQDTITLSPKDYEDIEEIYPAKKQGWLFKQGSDTTWARKNLDISTWKKLRPVDINASMADANGVFEGWFRAYIKIDSSFGETKLFAFFGSYAAQDLFIDGKRILSSGNTGYNGKPYQENGKSFQKVQTVLLSQFSAGSVHAIVWHIKDTKAIPLNGTLLKGQLAGLQNLFEIVSPNFNEWIALKDYFATRALVTSNSILFVLFILFLLLWRLNNTEKNLLRFTIFTGVYFLGVTNGYFFRSIWYPVDLTYSKSFVYLFVENILFSFLLSYSAVLISRLFDHKYSFISKWVVLGTVALGLLEFFHVFKFPFQINPAFLIVLILLFYFIISSWKKIDKTKAIIIGGIFAVIFFQLLIPITGADAIYRYKSFFTLLFLSSISFPISLMIYVAVRFKAILTEVQAKANTIIQLSEEKRIQAENQQKILQEEVDKQTVELRNSLTELKSTQSQLIQSEKMASLGELTAGIAHEIQNPLNFVNNFSELNVELMAELRVKNEELGIKNEDINDLVSDIQSNSEKINHHGQRAASIVKGMLQHSRTSSGQKELTDINALCDEYLRLAYHGLRAKDKSFNAAFKTEFDPNLPKINIIPQDMGRVVLNLINNAFFAVKQRQDVGTSEREPNDDPTIRRPDEEYTPMVIVSTRKKEDTIEITVSDNGTGIPNEIKEKIFQPFFTTKPTGQGTGLGLSLAYDIVTKVHGGKLTVESEQGRGTTFRIEVPV